MKRAALVLGLLLPLTAGATAPTAATSARAETAPTHVWPPLATATAVVRNATTPIFSMPPPASDLKSAVKAMEQIEAHPMPPASVPSLVHFNLKHGVRLALVTRPQVTTSIFGTSRSSIGLLSLQW